MGFFVLADLNEAFASKVREPRVGKVLVVEFGESLLVKGAFEVFEG